MKFGAGRKRLFRILLTIAFGAGLLSTVIITLGVFSFFACANLPPFPSDGELIKRFLDQKANFEELRRMCDEDREVFRVYKLTPGWLPPIFIPSRANQYEVLLRKAHIRRIFRNPVSGNLFCDVQQHLGGDAKGYAYLYRRPRHLERSLDYCLPFGIWSFHRDLQIADQDIALREIGGGWYIWRMLDNP